MNLKTLAALIVLINPFSVYANASPILLNDTVKGKPMGLLYKVYKGKDNIWLGGENGIYLLKGKYAEFIALPETGTIGDVWDIVEDEDANLWLATKGAGVLFYDRKKRNFTEFADLKSSSCGELALHRQGRILAICGGEIFSIKKSSIEKFAIFEDDIVITDAEVNDKGHVVALSLSSGVYTFNINGDLLNHTNLTSLTTDLYRKLYIDNDFNYWIGGEKSVVKLNQDFLNPKQFLFDGIQTESRWVKSIYQDSSGVIWVAADKLHVITKEKNSLSRPENFAPFLNNDFISRVNSISETDNGDLLFVSNLEGLMVVSSFSNSVKFLVAENKIPVKNIQASSVINEEKFLFVDENGIHEYSSSENSSHKLLPTQPYTLNITQISLDEYHLTFPGMWPQILQISERKIKPLSEEDSEFPSGNYNEITAIKNFGNVTYFAVFGNDKNGIYRVEKGEKYELILGDINVDEMETNHSGSVYFATRKKGVLEYNGSHFVRSWNSKQAGSTTSNCIEEDMSGVIWLCTNGHGLGFLNKDTGQIEYIDSKYTAESKFIRELVQDSEGYFWVMTNQGLVRYDHDNQHSIKIGKEEGIVDTDFEITASINLDKDRILIAGDKLNYIVNTIRANEYLDKRLNRTSEAYLIELDIFQRGERNIQSSADNSKVNFLSDEGITLSYDDFLFTLGFAANNYVDRNLLGFEYRLQGLDDKWVKVSPDSPTATFSTLPHGNYTFQLRVFDPKSKAAQPITSVKLTILPPFWLTWQAYLIYALSFFFILWQASRIRSQKIRKANVLLERAVNEKVHELAKSTVFVSDLLDQKRILFANVSHEFRTPLSLIMAPIEILKNSLSNQHQLQQAQLIKRNAKRLSFLVEQVLDLIKIEDLKELEYEHYDVAQSLDSLKESFLPFAQSKNQTLELIYERNAVVRLTTDSFEKITSNILINALKYSPHGGLIVVSAIVEKGFVNIKIKDNGPGIEKSEQQRIFKRFVRSTAAKDTAGSGLGLAVANELVLLNGGMLTISSDLGQGAEFTVQLALVGANDSKLEIKDTKFENVEIRDLIEDSNSLEYTPKPKKLDAPCILIIEDNRELREFLSDTMSEKFNCDVACDGREGFTLATESIPDVVIADLMMPELDGHQFADLLRNEETTAHVPIVLLTAKNEDDIRKQSWQKDIDDFVAKPFDVEELILRVERLLSLRERLKKQYARELSESFEVTSNKRLSFACKKDQDFYARFEETIERNYMSESFGRRDAANDLALSERQLNRKLAALIDHNFSDYLKKFRMKKAKEFLLEGRQITEVSFDIGFTSPSYFSSCFKTEFGVTPSEFVEANLQQQV